MSTVYDNVIYPNRCHLQTHPDRLGVVSALFGLNAAPPHRCRVLELGCGDGTNILPLAFSFPDSSYVGVDLAPTLIDRGRRSAGELRLPNIEFVEADLRTLPLDGEHFDFIIAHGVYSWVPTNVRAALMSLCRSRLSPQGVAFVSYNCLPGCHIRRIAWDIMKFHTRELTDPAERVEQAMAVCQLIANSMEKPDTYRSVLREQLTQIQRIGGGHLFHDDLAEVNHPVYFHEFISHAASNGLKFLGEADFFEMQDLAFSPAARLVLRQMKDSRITREQYLDFIKCRRFRQTLLCHHEVRLNEDFDPSAVYQFHVSSDAKLVKAQPGSTVVRFEEAKGGAIEVDFPLAKLALTALSEVWPATISFEELFFVASENLLPSGCIREHDARYKLAVVLLEAYRAGVVDFRRAPIECQAHPAAKPKIWDYARWQCAHGNVITTMRGDNLKVDDQDGLRLLRLLDGTRSLDELRIAIEAIGISCGGKEPDLVTRLEELGKLALLSA